MKSTRVLLLLAGFFLVLLAPQAVAQERAQTFRDDSEFRALHNPVISADGAWVAAEERSDRGDVHVRVWSTERDLTFTIERGQNPRISRDSRWVSASQNPPLEDSRTTKPKNQRARQTLVLLELQVGSRRTFDFVLSYDMTYSSTYLLYLQSPETKANEEPATKPATKERKVGTLHQIPLNPARLARILRPYQPDRMYTKENVVEIATHPTNDHFAYVFHDEETGGETLHIVKWGVRAWYKGDKIEGLCWAGGASGGDESITLGFLDSTDTTGKDGKRRVNSALYTWQPAQSGVEKLTQVRDDLEFRALHNPVISADGAWMAAEERPDRGDGNVHVWSTERDVTFTIERGQNPRISRDSRWVSALQKPSLEDSRTATPKNQRAGQTLVLLDLQNGSRRTFDFVLSYDVTSSSLWLIYLQSPETTADEEGHSIDEATKPATKPATKERTVGTLHMVHLESDKVVSAMENVAQHATHQTTDHFAYVLHDEETGRDTLYITALGRTGSWGIRASYNGEKIEGLCWAHDPITVGFLDSTETTGKDGKWRVNSALYMWHVTGPNVQGKFTRVDTPK
jgi:hypothetical protein